MKSFNERNVYRDYFMKLFWHFQTKNVFVIQRTMKQVNLVSSSPGDFMLQAWTHLALSKEGLAICFLIPAIIQHLRFKFWDPVSMFKFQLYFFINFIPTLYSFLLQSLL